MKTIIFYSIVLCWGLTGCVTEKADKINPPSASATIDVNRIADCHQQNNPYPSQISQHIEGSWVLTSEFCPMKGGTTSVSNQLVLTFNDGALYKIFKNGSLLEEGSYALTSSIDGHWSISNESSQSEYLRGDVLICNNEMVLYNSPLDGCDYYYVKQ